MSSIEEYRKDVARLEDSLAPYAQRSFDSGSQVFVDGTEVFSHYSYQWQQPNQKLKLLNRTPLQIERDRILYSGGMRKQTEKYHVLYNGQKRIVRNYTTHTMRMAQVGRSICRALRLNQDFAEAIAIGSKVGAVPFIHAAKEPISHWVRERILAIDESVCKQVGKRNLNREQLSLEFSLDASIPNWIRQLGSDTVRDKVRRYLPWAAGDQVEQLYSSGQESYWLLTTNPFLNETRTGAFLPETMYGIWRHSRGDMPGKNSFHHRCMIGKRTHEIKWSHATFESIVVQYADDITWAIENLNDANTAARLNNGTSIYEKLGDYLETQMAGDLPGLFTSALSSQDSGSIYTYFISDFATQSAKVLGRLDDSIEARTALREGSELARIGLSEDASRVLDQMIEFLQLSVFSEPRVKNRKAMLQTLTEACLDLLYSDRTTLERFVDEKSTVERWSFKVDAAKKLLDDDVHRIQVAVDVLAEMGDQEIYDFVGIQSL